MRKLFFLAATFLAWIPVLGQDFKDQIHLIRPRPENCVIYGPITVGTQLPLVDATVSLLDLSTLEAIEKLQSDRNGWYLFTLVTKGKKYAILIEKDGYFPYYHEFKIPAETESSFQEKPLILPADLLNEYVIFYPPYDTTPGPVSKTQISHLATLLKKHQELVAFIEPLGDSIDPIRINLLTTNLVNRGVKPSQITTGAGIPSQSNLIRIEIRTGTDESGIPVAGEAPLTDDRWTIQFSASRSKLGRKSFKGLDPIHEFKGKDGFYRYTYGNFATREEASEQLKLVKKKGFSQAFAKTVGSIKKL